ncbi:hypothetical protein MKX03_010380 [Papaver bracteatum]|nr:hypothetical protein MKX03_010380 [Papaver bracteatum]
MDEDSNSWIRRVKYSHTVCHRLDSSRLVPITRQTNREAGLKSRPTPTATVDYVKPSPYTSPIVRNPNTNKLRAVSPHPEISISDAFKEARKSRKRFSTPLPRSRTPEKRGFGKFLRQNSNESRATDCASPSGGKSFGQFTSPKHIDKAKSRKDSWTKYFDNKGGKVMAIEMDDELNVDLSKLFLGHRFACGANSRLYHGVYKDQPVAVKIIRQSDDEENADMAARLEKQFEREVSLLSHLHHQNIIELVAASKNPPVFCIITEYLAGGSLRAFMHKLEHKTLPFEKVIGIALDIARGMEFLHSQGVVHRDLKPENLIFDQDNQVKIVDFGIACKEAYCDSLADDAGTYRWMAPEMIKRKSHGRKVDVYSFGLVIWEMVAGTIPFDDKTPIQAAFAVVNKKMRPIIPKDCPPSLRDLIEHCWTSVPEKRPEFWQIVKVLEQFETSLAQDGTVHLIRSSTSDDHKKGLLHWIHKLGHHHHSHHSSHDASQTAKPRFP